MYFEVAVLLTKDTKYIVLLSDHKLYIVDPDLSETEDCFSIVREACSIQ